MVTKGTNVNGYDTLWRNHLTYIHVAFHNEGTSRKNKHRWIAKAFSNYILITIQIKRDRHILSQNPHQLALKIYLLHVNVVQHNCVSSHV